MHSAAAVYNHDHDRTQQLDPLVLHTARARVFFLCVFAVQLSGWFLYKLSTVIRARRVYKSSCHRYDGLVNTGWGFAGLASDR